MKISIERMDNGWLLTTTTVNDLGEPWEYRSVFQDFQGPGAWDGSTAGNLPAVEALRELLWDAFEGYTQSKRRAGLKLEVAATGWESEEE